MPSETWPILSHLRLADQLVEEIIRDRNDLRATIRRLADPTLVPHERERLARETLATSEHGERARAIRLERLVP